MSVPTNKNNLDAITVASFLGAAVFITGFWEIVSKFAPPTAVFAVFVVAVAARFGLRRFMRSQLKSKVSSVFATDVEAEVHILASLAGVRVDRVLVQDANVPNACWFATGNRRGMMVVSTKLATGPHLRAVVAHELGHGVCNHHRGKLVMSEAMKVARIAPALLAFSASFTATFAATAFTLVASKVVLAAYSRRLERQADRFAGQLVGGEPAARLFDFFHTAGFGVDRKGVSDNLLATHPFSAQRAVRMRARR
jgi:Zn-dependent protease with chaperone function